MGAPLLAELGHVRAVCGDTELNFVPSLGRLTDLGGPEELVEIFADLHGEGRMADAAARCVLVAFCEQGADAALAYSGWDDLSGAQVVELPGAVSKAEARGLARHLMLHGIMGRARPKRGGVAGRYATKFNVTEHVAAAMAHLGLRRDEALSLTMTELQGLIEAKYPDSKADLPTRDEYRAQMAAIMDRRRAAGAHAAS